MMHMLLIYEIVHRVNWIEIRFLIRIIGLKIYVQFTCATSITEYTMPSLIGFYIEFISFARYVFNRIKCACLYAIPLKNQKHTEIETKPWKLWQTNRNSMINLSFGKHSNQWQIQWKYNKNNNNNIAIATSPMCNFTFTVEMVTLIGFMR